MPRAHALHDAIGMKWLIAPVMLVGGIAHAEPARYVEGGAMIGVGVPALLNILGSVGAGVRLEAVPLWLHAQVEYGPAGDDQGSGTMGQLRAGAETRTCTRGRGVCAFAGLDVGGLHGTWTRRDHSDHEDVRAVIAVPRIGLEGGGPNVVATATLEVAAMLGGTRAYPDSTKSATGFGAVELGLGVAYRW